MGRMLLMKGYTPADIRYLTEDEKKDLLDWCKADKVKSAGAIKCSTIKDDPKLLDCFNTAREVEEQKEELLKKEL